MPLPRLLVSPKYNLNLPIPLPLRLNRSVQVLVGVVAFFTFLVGLSTFHPIYSYGAASIATTTNDVQPAKEVRFAKASMLYGEHIALYERALKTHERHNELHGYEMHVLRERITTGYWNKLAYMMSLVVQELGKEPTERVDWIMWLDVPTLLLNPLVPLSTFLPPSEGQFSHVHFIGARHMGHLLPSCFFLHVHSWTLKFLVKAMSIPFLDSQAELGNRADATAMAYILNETDFRSNVFYEPEAWFGRSMTMDGWAGERGDMVVHFPRELGGARWKGLSEWLDQLDRDAKIYELELPKTQYPTEVEAFWYNVRQMRGTLKRAQDKVVEKGGQDKASQELNKAVERLKDVISFEPDSLTAVEEAVNRALAAIAAADG